MAALAIGALLGLPRSGIAANPATPANTSPPSISGTFQETDTVTAATGSWNNNPASYSYVWERCDADGGSCAAISGETGQSIQLHTADDGHTIRVVVTATNSAGSATATSDPSPTVASTKGPGNSALPTVTGTAQDGQTLTASTGSWTNSPTSYTYVWERCNSAGDACTAISGATAQTFQLSSADVNYTVRAVVTAKNADGTATATTAPTATVAAKSSASLPQSTTAPAITGTPTVGSALTGSQGTWNNSPSSWAYSWSRCDTKGDACGAIAGATGTSYTLTQADAGSTLRFTVTATNSAGSSQAISAPSAVVSSGSTTTTAADGCPSGTGLIQISDLALPARLNIDEQTITPGVVTPSTGTVQLHFRVTACGGRPVQGALAFASPVPYNQFSAGQATTGPDGMATMTLNERSGFPAARRQELLAVFTRATKPGDKPLGGVSTRRLVTFPVRLR
ncbi:MAG TPA: hypothetical protein VHD91_04340 [Gaiellaceae bacterium]|nr:hypothetical protein [Gaiellaceae bacterium]